jgi:hypothetical protein
MTEVALVFAVASLIGMGFMLHVLLRIRASLHELVGQMRNMEGELARVNEHVQLQEVRLAQLKREAAKQAPTGALDGIANLIPGGAARRWVPIVAFAVREIATYLGKRATAKAVSAPRSTERVEALGETK